MRIGYLFGIIIVLFSCKEAPIVVPPPPAEEVVEVDSAPPIIKWISPRFDEVVKDILNIKAEVLDTSGIYETVLVIDSLQPGILGSAVTDSVFEFYWDVSQMTDGSEHNLVLFAEDKAGNDTSSQRIRVFVDNSQSYPGPVDIISIDSVIIESNFSGFKIKWNKAEGLFSQYILEKSSSPVMMGSSELFTADIVSQTQYEDATSVGTEINYYRIMVQDPFGRRTPGNIVSTTMDDMPSQWNVTAVNYKRNWVTINWTAWDSASFPDYKFHQLLSSATRDGIYDTLATYYDPQKNNYQFGGYEPHDQNWFTVLTGDGLGQISIGNSYMHSHPREPVIDSVLYSDGTFTMHWATEPDGDFIHYQVLQSDNENPFDFMVINLIENRTDTTLTIPDIIESEYYLYQIITKDAWELETRGQVITASSFYKFANRIGGAENDELYAVITKDDGGYLAVGGSFNQGSWLVNINSLGAVEDSVYFGEAHSGFRDIANALDGGFILTGYSRIDEKENILVVKTDGVGNQEWLNNFSYNDNTGSNAVIGLSDGNLGITGYSNSNNNQDVFVLKLDTDGNVLWSKTVGGNKTDEGHDILATENGGMVVLGVTHSQGDNDGDIWILKFDSEGNSIDTLLISMEGKQVGYSFVKTDLNEYVIGGITSGNSGVTDAFIIKVNELGEVEWEFSYGGIYNDIGYSIIYSDGGWVLAGQTYSYDVGGGDILLLKVNDFGELEWVETIGGNFQDSAYDIKLAQDGGYIISGSTYSQNNTDGWLIKTDSHGNFRGMLEYP